MLFCFKGLAFYADKAREFNVLPVGWRELHGTGCLLVAVSDPTNLQLLDHLHFMTGFRIAPTLALETEIRDAIEFYYGSTDTKQPAPAEQPIPAASALTETKFQSLLKLLLDKGVLTLREYERMR